MQLMCEVLGVSKSGFFDWCNRDHHTKQMRKSAIIGKIVEIHLASRKNYGSPRVFKALQQMGEKIGKPTVERLMRDHGIHSKSKKKFKVTTDSKHSLPVASNLANREFAPGVSNKLWCSDITYLWTNEGWLYLAAIIDAGTRKLVGWAMQDRMTQDIVLSALMMAIQRQNPGRGLLHHSDRGSQYASQAYQLRLEQYGMICSMSRKGNCWDNAVVESFFHTLKTEHVYHQIFKTRAEAKSSLFEWIEIFYNRKRIHSALGYVTPQCYEMSLAKCA